MKKRLLYWKTILLNSTSLFIILILKTIKPILILKLRWKKNIRVSSKPGNIKKTACISVHTLTPEQPLYAWKLSTGIFPLKSARAEDLAAVKDALISI
ncbi:MAG: hypothetical protein A2096_11340 [Spirochaetes bacterium GWF1_41_5]|nr:MAG: hypothetical protein A2096_11340 [Spirochaetes bacterium GWF1_41_5]